MSSKRNFQMLVRYNAWANQKLFAHLSMLSDIEIDRTRNQGSGSIIKTLNHAYVVDQIWKANLQSVQHGFTSRNTETFPVLSQLSKLQASTDSWYIEFVERQTMQTLAERISFVFVGGEQGTMTCGDMILHIVNHKTFHRGYVAEMLYESGLKPPSMDLPVYLRNQRMEVESFQDSHI